jgi:hypothetical protein
MVALCYWLIAIGLLVVSQAQNDKSSFPRRRESRVLQCRGVVNIEMMVMPSRKTGRFVLESLRRRLHMRSRRLSDDGEVRSSFYYSPLLNAGFPLARE